MAAADPDTNFRMNLSKNCATANPAFFRWLMPDRKPTAVSFLSLMWTTPWLDGKHTVFGEVVSDADQKVVNKIAQGDKINSITIEGDIAELMEKVKPMIDKWNAALDANFPKLPSAPKV